MYRYVIISISKSTLKTNEKGYVMAALSLRDTINSVMGLDHCVFMTQYFTDGEADIFLVVNNDVDDSYHLFYDEGGEIKVYKIGGKQSFKRFVCRAYNLNQIGSHSNDFWGKLPQSCHAQAKQRACKIMRDTIAREAAALALMVEAN